MITLNQLSKQCEKVLNAKSSLLDGFVENAHFEFTIHTNEGEYIRASRTHVVPRTVAEANEITYHINALMKVISSTLDGDYKAISSEGYLTSTDFSDEINVALTSSIEFIIPFPSHTVSIAVNEGGGNEVREYNFGETVYSLISQTLQQGWSENMTDAEGASFLVGSRFTLPTVNVKEIRAVAAESLPITVFGEHFFVAQGVNSSRIKLYRFNSTNNNYEPIFATTIGIARRSMLEPALFPSSSSSHPTSKNINQGSQLTISLSMPFRLGVFGEDISNYVALGVQPHVEGIGFPFRLEIPKSVNENNTIYLDLIFSDVGINGAIGTAASVMVQLAEVFNG